MPYNGIQVCSFSAVGQQALVAVESFDDDVMTDARLAERKCRKKIQDARGKALGSSPPG
jgi:hypothetical protein